VAASAQVNVQLKLATHVWFS